MLDAQSIDLHYGAAQALRGVSIKADPGKVTCVLGRNDPASCRHGASRKRQGGTRSHRSGRREARVAVFRQRESPAPRPVRRSVGRLRRGHFRAEEDELFPFLRRRLSDEPARAALLDELATEHRRLAELRDAIAAADGEGLGKAQLAAVRRAHEQRGHIRTGIKRLRRPHGPPL